MKLCIKEGCLNKSYAKSLCKIHYVFLSNSNRSPINKVSKSRAKGLVIYGREKADYFKQYPVCEFPGCESDEVTLHHAKGRIGALLYDKTHFKSLCWLHHKFCEENPELAKQLELSINRLSI